MLPQLIESWEIHNRINLFLLNAVNPEAWTATSASGGRTVGDQFGHIHNVRKMWLEQAAPDLNAPLEKLAKGCTDGAALTAALEASSAAIVTLLTRSLEGDGRIKSFRPHAVAFFSYLVSHESHHRGQIAMTLKQAGFPLDKKVAYGIWEWSVR
jgi:uncharacterized damage-inducible protein DinB